VIAGFFLYGLIYADKIYPGVKVGDIGVGGLSRAEAASLVKSRTDPLLKQPVQMVYQDRRWDLVPKDVGVQVNQDRTFEAAYNIGREGDPWSRALTQLSALFGGSQTAVVVDLDGARFQEFLRSATADLERPAVNATLIIDQGTIKVTSEAEGQRVDALAAKELLCERAISSNREFKLPVGPAVPRLKASDFNLAIQQASQILSGPLTLRFESKSWMIDQAALADFLTVSAAPEWDPEGTLTAESAIRARLNGTKLRDFLAPIAAEIEVPAKNASFEVQDGKVVAVLPSQTGRKLDIDQAIRLINAVAISTSREVFLPVTASQPNFTTEQANAYGPVLTKISSYTTSEFHDPETRGRNIVVGAAHLNGILLAPGEVFSFWDRLGEVSYAEGYVDAGMIINGVSSKAIGGGLCQVSTTVFNATLLAGLPILERHEHSYHISRYPDGRDGASSYPDQDLKFMNDTKSPILIKSYCGDDTVTFEFYGQEHADGELVVEDVGASYIGEHYTGVVVSEPYQYNYTYPSPDQPADPAFAPGAMIPGYSVTVSRTVTKGGVVIRSPDINPVPGEFNVFVSLYHPVRGGGPSGGEPSPSPAPTPGPSSTPAVTPTPGPGTPTPAPTVPPTPAPTEPPATPTPPPPSATPPHT